VTVSDIDLSRRRRDLYESTAGLYTATFHVIWRVGFPHVHTWLTEALRDSSVIRAYVKRIQAFIPARLGVAVIQGDVTAAPFPSASFDAILCSGVLDTMPDPVPALSELSRLLRPQGTLLLILRARGSRMSKLVEQFFRTSISLFRLITRSGGGGLDPELWSRTAISPRLVEFADHAGLTVEDIRYGRMLTRAALRPISTQSGRDGSSEDDDIDRGVGQDGSDM
jgi:SAM-dependent methyltransferase